MKENLIPFENILQNSGYKFTSQKQIILRTILESKKHLKAKDIYENIKEQNIGLATVYRSLKVFKELGIVKEININGNSYYEMKMFSKNPKHIHLKCLKCNRIIDVDNESLNSHYLNLNRKMETENNFQIYDSDILFIGLCNECREK